MSVGGRMSVGGLILAPGLHDRPVLQSAIDAHCAVDQLDRVLVVLGANAELIARTLRLGRAQAAVCVDWDSGLNASLKLGMHALSEIDRVILTLADQPPIDADLICRFVHEPPGTRVAYEGRPGYPVVLGNHHRAAIDQLSGDDGLSTLLQNARLIECGRAVPADADTAA
jgi:CTP:molybdopterin cytidylyltransferase MocA